MKTLYSYRPSLPFTIFPQSCHAVFIFLFSFCIQSFEIVAQTPVAKFTFLRTKTCIKTTGDAVVVSFKDESLGGAHSSEWAFGDGGTSSNPNPSRTYTAAGVYYVTLTVTIADQSSSITQQVVIFPEPEVKFTSDINSGCPPLKVVFTDLTKALEIKDPLNGNVYKEELSSRDWTFGDGTPVITDIVGSVTHTYTTAGSRDVGLTVTSEGGCKVFASSLKGFIKVFEPAAPDFYLPPPTTCQYPVTVTATNNSVGSTTFKWSSTVPSAVTISDPAAENPSFTFSIPGNYTIKLITATVNGCIGEKEFNYFLPPTNITASFTSINNTCANTTVKFTNTSNPEPISNKWFIDGVQVGNQKDLSYPFPTAGSFLVRLETQIGGCLTFSEKNLVVDPIPLLDFNTLNTSTCTFPFPVTFNDNSSGPILKRTWDFGDGSSQIDNPPFSSNVSHTYNKEGVFSVRLTLTTDKNCSVSKLIPNMVSIIAPKILKQNLPDSGCVPFVLEPKIQFDNPSQLTSWDWEYKDRNGNLLLSSNASSPPSFTINDSGIYRVDLKVTTQDGCQKSYFWDVKAGKVPKDFDFEASPLDDCASQTFIFKFKELAPDYLTGYTWVFNQKDTVRQKNPSKKFKKIEPVDVQLIVFQYGCSKEITKNDYVNVKGVVSAFSVLNDCSAPYERVVVDNSLGNIQNWVLNFGDGYTENYTTKQNSIKHTYASPGQYTVSLKVSDGVCDYIDSVIVRLADEQKVDFSFDKFPLCVSDTFMLINAVVDNSQFIKSYNWDLGCGFNGPGNSKSLKIKFSDLCKYSSNGGRGMYKMQLRIVDANNCVISSPIKNVMVGGPVADYSTLSPVTGCTNLPVNFKDNTSTDGSTPIVSRLWTFGDGTAPKNILSGQVSHVYSKDGIFPVTLTVTDAVGCTSTKSGINIATSDPDIDVFSFETVSCLNKNIQLEAKSSATLVSYVWNLGDGIIKNNVANPRVSYSAVGLKTIVLTVKDLLGCEKTITKSNFLTIDMPMATFVADKLVSDCPPFNANFSFNGNFAESFEWDFGDGTTSALKDPSHLYQQSGNYPVTLTVTSPGGCVATSSSPVVLQVKGPRGAVAFKPTLCEPYNAEFNITHENTDYVFIDYGDGNVSGNIPVADMIPYSYTDTGLYQPNVFLLNTNGCTVFLKSPNDIRTVSLEPKFTPDINFMCDNGRVEFTDRTLANEKLVSWQWDFGDTKTGVGPRPANFYSRPGIYSVKLNVISQSGCQKSLTRSSIIEVQARPDIGIQSNKAIICEDDIIQFTGIEVVPNNSPTVSWFWDFTNGNSATGQFPPPQQFRKGGIYPFRLYATNSKGCSDTLFQNFTVNPNPIVDAGADIVFCLGKPVSLTPQGGLSYQWDQAPGISCTNCTSPTINPSSDAVYRVKGISSLGCFAYDSVRVKVIQPSTIKAIADTLVCEGQSVQLTSSGTELVSWSPATGLSRTDVFSPIAKPSQTITYTVTGKDIYNCFTTKDDVVVRVIPNPKVDVGNDTTVKAGYPFTINPSYSNDVARVQWVPSLFLNCSNCKTPVSTPSYSATYTVFAYTPEGCMSKDVINVFVTCTKDNLFIPTTFSPNGDGMNEVFFPRGRGIEKIRSMKVFSRWGQLIYEKQNFLANDQSAGWDGRKAGQYVTPDVYVYMIELVCENGNIITLKGDVTLIR